MGIGSRPRPAGTAHSGRDPESGQDPDLEDNPQGKDTKEKEELHATPLGLSSRPPSVRRGRGRDGSVVGHGFLASGGSGGVWFLRASSWPFSMNFVTTRAWAWISLATYGSSDVSVTLTPFPVFSTVMVILS